MQARSTYIPNMLTPTFSTNSPIAFSIHFLYTGINSLCPAFLIGSFSYWICGQTVRFRQPGIRRSSFLHSYGCRYQSRNLLRISI